MDANETKTLLTSRTFWGAAVAAGAGVYAIFGHSISAEDQAAIADNAVTVATGVVTIAGAALAIYGRIKATKQIGGGK